jgi:hypothetical protein
MNAYKSFAITVKGGSHEKHGKACQDASRKGDNAGVAIAVVADGHGDDNCFRSDKGAEFAADCAVTGMLEFVKHQASKFSSWLPFGKKIVPLQSDFEKEIRNLVKHIIVSWQGKVEEDYDLHPFTPEELESADEKHRRKFNAGNDLNKTHGKAYGTTLIAAVITKHYWFGVHIGDGRFTALYPNGSFDQPVPWDRKCYLNVTTSICDDDVFENIRCYSSFISKEKPAPVAVFLCTDGVDDNYPVDGNEKHLFKLYRTVAITFAEDGFNSTCVQLKDLAGSFATKGKGDDTSIAGFIDMETLKQAVPIWQKQIAEEEKGVVEKTAYP